jgi:hypothetical protein
MDFNSLVDMLQNPPEDGLPATIYDDLRGAYDEVSSGFDSAKTKIEEMTSQNGELNDLVNSLKSKNYDLLTAVSDGSSTAESGDSDNVDDYQDDGSIDAYFQNQGNDKEKN